MTEAIPAALLITLYAALLAYLAVLLIQLASHFVRPLLAGIAALFPAGKLVTKAAKWYQALPKIAKIALWPAVPVVGVPIAVVKGVQLIEAKVTQALGHFALSASRPAAAFMSALATEVTALSTQTYALANTTWHAMSYLVRHTVPELAAEAVADIRIGYDGAARTLDRFGELVEQGIDRLSSRVGALERAVAGIDVLGVVAYVDQSIDRLTRALLSQLGAVSAGIYAGIDALRRDLLGRIEGLAADTQAKLDSLIRSLDLTAITAAAVAAVVAFAPELFCRNTRNTAQKLCGLDTALLDAVLGLSLALLVVIDPVKIAQAALAAEEVMEPVIREVAG